MHKSRLAGFIIDCKDTDPIKAANFWSQALGMEKLSIEENLYVRLDGTSRDLHIEVQRVTHESRVHLDIETDNIDAEVARLEVLGAKRIEKKKTWWVMEAPTGQRFCMVKGKGLDMALCYRPGSQRIVQFFGMK